MLLRPATGLVGGGGVISGEGRRSRLGWTGSIILGIGTGLGLGGFEGPSTGPANGKGAGRRFLSCVSWGGAGVRGRSTAEMRRGGGLEGPAGAVLPASKDLRAASMLLANRGSSRWALSFQKALNTYRNSRRGNADRWASEPLRRI
jgi:hypothetical protein